MPGAAFSKKMRDALKYLSVKAQKKSGTNKKPAGKLPSCTYTVS